MEAKRIKKTSIQAERGLTGCFGGKFFPDVVLQTIFVFKLDWQ